MNSIAELLKERVLAQSEKPKRGTEWTDLVQQFQFEINKERLGTKYKPLSYMAVQTKLKHLDTSTLYWFMSICKDYKARHGSFAKCFFGSLKIK